MKKTKRIVIPKLYKKDKAYLWIDERYIKILKIMGGGSVSKGTTTLMENVYSDLAGELKENFSKELKENFKKGELDAA